MIDSWADYDHIGGGPRYTRHVIAPDCPNGKLIDFWIEFWLPNSPEHIIRRATIQLEVEGNTDRTPPVFKWLQVRNDFAIEVKLGDASKIKRTTVRFVPDKVKSIRRYLKWEEPDKFSVELNDQGLDGDKCAGDNVFSTRIAGKSSYFYKAEIIMEDDLGNTDIFHYDKSVFLQDTH